MLLPGLDQTKYYEIDNLSNLQLKTNLVQNDTFCSFVLTSRVIIQFLVACLVAKMTLLPGLDRTKYFEIDKFVKFTAKKVYI